jgi:NAD(P)-dependent dehydrogenase (short-subunit alcohol dehydrogenase family)
MEDIMDLKGKNCIITGANSGLGFTVSKKFSSYGANTILVCRNKEKGENAIHKIKQEIPKASVELMICDLSSIKSITNFIKEFKDKHSKLDILFNNAGVMRKNRTKTKDGFEMMFQVNYLAPFILMNSFEDVLRKSKSPLIINNGRPADKLRLDIDDLQFEKEYHMYQSFFKTKLCLLFASLEYCRKHKDDDISITMADPGSFKSNLVRDMPLIGWFKNLFSVPVDKAAENIMYVTTSNIDKNGRVFKERKEYHLTDYWNDASISKELWSITESLINI